MGELEENDPVKIFQHLKRIIKKFESPLQPKLDLDSKYDLWSFKDVVIDGRKRKEIFFASIIIQSRYVGFYFMPAYTDTALKRLLQPELLNLLKGKSCFHIRNCVGSKTWRQSMTIKRLFPLFIPALFLLVSCEEKEERSGPVTFTHSPVAYDRIYSSTPLGNLNPPGHVLPSNHMGFYLNGTTPAEIRAVADGRITTVYYNSSFDDYRIEFEHTRTFYSYLDHVSDIPAAIVEGADVKAGDLMGTGDGFDLGVVDYEITRNFIVPARYHDFSIHCGDPYLYFTPQIRDSLLMYNRRTVEPRGGKIDFDMQDGLAGNWFMVGTPLTYEASSYLYAANQIAFVYDMWEPENIRIVCGGTLELAPFDLRVDGNSPDPALVTSSSHLVKYELLRTPRATLLVRMYGPRKIRVEVFPNKTKSEVSDFTAAGKTYIR